MELFFLRSRVLFLTVLFIPTSEFGFIRYHFSTVSAQSIKSNLDSMEHQIQRLENDMKKFSKTEDPHDKFVEKMIISFGCCGFTSQC